MSEYSCLLVDGDCCQNDLLLFYITPVINFECPSTFTLMRTVDEMRYKRMMYSYSL